MWICHTQHHLKKSGLTSSAVLFCRHFIYSWCTMLGTRLFRKMNDLAICSCLRGNVPTPSNLLLPVLRSGPGFSITALCLCTNTDFYTLFSIPQALGQTCLVILFISSIFSFWSFWLHELEVMGPRIAICIKLLSWMRFEPLLGAESNVVQKRRKPSTPRHGAMHLGKPVVYMAHYVCG